MRMRNAGGLVAWLRVGHNGFGPEGQATRTCTGMGEDINAHDQCANESQGAIQDRMREHLATE